MLTGRKNGSKDTRPTCSTSAPVDHVKVSFLRTSIPFSGRLVSVQVLASDPTELGAIPWESDLCQVALLDLGKDPANKGKAFRVYDRSSGKCIVTVVGKNLGKGDNHLTYDDDMKIDAHFENYFKGDISDEHKLPLTAYLHHLSGPRIHREQSLKHIFSEKNVALLISVANPLYQRVECVDGVLDALVRANAKKITTFIGGSFQGLNREFIVDHSKDDDSAMSAVLNNGNRDGVAWYEKFTRQIFESPYYSQLAVMHSRELETGKSNATHYRDATARIGDLLKSNADFKEAVKKSAEEFELRELPRIANEFIHDYGNNERWTKEINELKDIFKKHTIPKHAVREVKRTKKVELINALKNFLNQRKEWKINTDTLFANFMKAVEVECRYYWIFLTSYDSVIYAGSEIPAFKFLRGFMSNSGLVQQGGLAEWIEFAATQNLINGQITSDDFDNCGIGVAIRNPDGSIPLPRDESKPMYVVEINNHGKKQGTYEDIIDFVEALVESNRQALAGRVLSSLLRLQRNILPKQLVAQIDESIGLLAGRSVSNLRRLSMFSAGESEEAEYDQISALIAQYGLNDPDPSDISCLQARPK